MKCHVVCVPRSAINEVQVVYSKKCCQDVSCYLRVPGSAINQVQSFVCQEELSMKWNACFMKCCQWSAMLYVYFRKCSGSAVIEVPCCVIQKILSMTCHVVCMFQEIRLVKWHAVCVHGSALSEVPCCMCSRKCYQWSALLCVPGSVVSEWPCCVSGSVVPEVPCCVFQEVLSVKCPVVFLEVLFPKCHVVCFYKSYHWHATLCFKKCHLWNAMLCIPGSAIAEVPCWRPAGKSCASELRRFFIGGCPELDDPTYTAQPSAFEVSFYK